MVSGSGRIRFKLEQPNLCLIFNSNKMKKVILVSMFFLAFLNLTSCSNDDTETIPKNNQVNIVTSDPTNGQTPTTPPKP